MEFVERNHFSHPQHKLLLEKQYKAPFECNGCHQNGIGPRFNCSLCNFNLHTHCANTIPTSDAMCHHFHLECKFKFHLTPPGDSPIPCNACGQDVKGFVYYCEKCKHALHPCCAALPRVIEAKDGLPLHLHREAVASCDLCGQKNKKNESWSYRSACNSYNFHVTCVMETWLKHPKEISFDGDGCNSKLSTVMQSNFSITKVKSNKVEKKWKKKLKNYLSLQQLSCVLSSRRCLGIQHKCLSRLLPPFNPNMANTVIWMNFAINLLYFISYSASTELYLLSILYLLMCFML